MRDWEATIMVGGLPALYNEYLSHAKFVEEIDLNDTDQTGIWFIGLRNLQTDRSDNWPSIVIVQRYEPYGYGFTPAALIISESSTLFLGAGTRILTFNLKEKKLISEYQANVGFWGWERYGNIVLMSCELEFAAWDKTGRKLWSTFVEPPWSFSIHDDQVQLDVMGRKTSFNLVTGP